MLIATMAMVILRWGSLSSGCTQVAIPRYPNNLAFMCERKFSQQEWVTKVSIAQVSAIRCHWGVRLTATPAKELEVEDEALPSSSPRKGHNAINRLDDF